MTLVVYGLKTCDTCRKALKALSAAGVEARLHDLREDGLDPDALRRWTDAAGWERLLNTRSTTWRGLDEADKTGVDAAKAFDLMTAHPTLVKRPVIEQGGTVHAGWTKAAQAALLVG